MKKSLYYITILILLFGFYFSFTHNKPPFFMSIPAVTEQRPGYSMNSWSSVAEQYKQTLSLISL